MQSRSAVVVLNYHRVLSAPASGSASWLHTVSTSILEQQIALATQLGSVISLGDACEGTHLSRINFVITFDDVPRVSMAAIEKLLKDGLPLTASICAGLASNGHGWRDMVYAICEHINLEELRGAVKSWTSGKVVIQEPKDFYKFTKDPDLRSTEVTKELIEPLFGSLPPDLRASVDASYVTWGDVVDLSRHEGLTVANHSWSHVRYESLDHAERADDIDRGHAAIEMASGVSPKHFVVPFGAVTQELLMDVTTICQERDYLAVLWTEQRANLLARPYFGGRFVNLLRLEPLNNLGLFRTQLRVALAKADLGPVDLLPVRRTRYKTEVVVDGAVQAGAIEAARPLEVVLRPDKDYATAPAFISHAYTSNPFRHHAPICAVARTTRGAEAVAYALHVPFLIGGVPFDGAYVAGWRTLPEASVLSAPAVFREISEGHDVVGVYKPSKASERALRGWRRIDVYSHLIATDTPGLDQDAQLTVALTTKYDARLDAIAQSIAPNGLTVARTPDFYKWRIDAYPLAESRYYLSLSTESGPVAFAILVYTSGMVTVVDFAALQPTSYKTLFQAALAQAAADGVPQLSVETSSPRVSGMLSERLGCSPEHFTNYYLLSQAASAALADDRHSTSPVDWRRVHETVLTGDVLPR